MFRDKTAHYKKNMDNLNAYNEGKIDFSETEKYSKKDIREARRWGWQKTLESYDIQIPKPNR